MIRKAGFKIATLLSVILIGAVSLSGCGNSNPEKDGKTVMKVGYFPNITHTQALVGLNDGTFKKTLGDNVVIEEHKFNAGPAEIEALLAVQIDLEYK